MSRRYVIFADDDPDDLELITGFFHEFLPDVPALELSNGSEVLRFLRHLPPSDSLPELVVLDINMPKLNGKEVLRAIRLDPRLAFIPVILYSTSLTAEDQAFCQQHQASWMSKPAHMDGIRETARVISEFCTRAWH